MEFPIGIFVTGINDAICFGAKNSTQIGLPDDPAGQ